VEPLICCWGETQTQGLADSLRHFWLEVAVDAGVSINRGLSPIMPFFKTRKLFFSGSQFGYDFIQG
jgi:hypothetical protein